MFSDEEVDLLFVADEALASMKGDSKKIVYLSAWSMLQEGLVCLDFWLCFLQLWREYLDKEREYIDRDKKV